MPQRRSRPKPAYTDLNPKYTFDSFVIGSSNRFAHAAALAVAESPGTAYNPLFIYGGTGLGKPTCSRRSRSTSPSTRAASTVPLRHQRDLHEQLHQLAARQADRGQAALPHVRPAPDRRHPVLRAQGVDQEEFFHTFNSLYEAGRQIVISSDRPAAAFPTLEERLRSRFEWGLITDIQPPDLETRIAILRKKVKTDGPDIPDPQILTFIAGHLSSNIRELEGALTRVVAFSSLTGRPITVELAGCSPGRLSTRRRAGPGVSIEGIQDPVSQRFSLKPQVAVRRPSQNIVYPARSRCICHAS